MKTVDLLEHLILRVPCAACGASYDVPFRHVLESQQFLHDCEKMWDEGCPNYCRDAACEPLAYASLVSEFTAREVQHDVADAVHTLERSGFDVDVSCMGS